MNILTTAVKDYLALRRSVGFKLRKHERNLNEFVQFLKEKGASHITTVLALEWARKTRSQVPNHWADRLSQLRGFAQYWSATDPRTEVPPWGLMPFRSRRARPYLYSSIQVTELLQAALSLKPLGGLRGWTYYTLLGLLASTGLRLGEAMNLQTADVDLEHGLLTIRQTKFGKSRLVPLHPSTIKVLIEYAARRDRFLRGRPAASFLVSQRAKPLDDAVVHLTFYQLSRQTGLRSCSDSHGPRLHDFRQNAESGKMSSCARTVYRMPLEYRHRAISSVHATRHYFPCSVVPL